MLHKRILFQIISNLGHNLISDNYIINISTRERLSVVLATFNNEFSLFRIIFLSTNFSGNKGATPPLPLKTQPSSGFGHFSTLVEKTPDVHFSKNFAN
jgi:hypothetical protein